MARRRRRRPAVRRTGGGGEHALGSRCRSRSPTSGGASSGSAWASRSPRSRWPRCGRRTRARRGEELSSVLLMDMLGVATGAGLGGAAVAHVGRASTPRCAPGIGGAFALALVAALVLAAITPRIPSGAGDRGRRGRRRERWRRSVRVGVQLPEVEREVRWPEYVAMAHDGRARRVRLGLGGRPPALSRRRPTRARSLGSVDDPRRDRRGDRAGRARPAGRVRRVPRTGDAREAGGDRRRDLGRAARARARGRVERGGVPSVRVPVRPAGVEVRGIVRGRSAGSSPANG